MADAQKRAVSELTLNEKRFLWMMAERYRDLLKYLPDREKASLGETLDAILRKTGVLTDGLN